MYNKIRLHGHLPKNTAYLIINGFLFILHSKEGGETFSSNILQYSFKTDLRDRAFTINQLAINVATCSDGKTLKIDPKKIVN